MPSPFQHGGAEECDEVAGTSSVSTWQVDNNHGYIPEDFRKAPCDVQTTLEISPGQDVLGIESSHHGKDLRLCDHKTPGNSVYCAGIDKFGVRWENDCSLLRKPHIQPCSERRLETLPHRSFLQESDSQFCTKPNYFGNHNMHQEDPSGIVDADKSMDGEVYTSLACSDEQQGNMQECLTHHSQPLSSYGFYRYRSSSKIPYERHDCLGSPQSILYHGIFSNSARMSTTSGRSIPELNSDRSAYPSVDEAEESVDFEVACSEEGDRVVSIDSMIFPVSIKEFGAKGLSDKEDGCGRSSIPPEDIDSIDVSLGHIGAFSSPRHEESAEPVNFELLEADNFVNKCCQQQKLSNSSVKTKGFVDRHGVRWTGDCEYLTRPVVGVVSYQNQEQAGSQNTLKSHAHSLVDKDFSSFQTSGTETMARDVLSAYADAKNDIDLRGGCQTHQQLVYSSSIKKQVIHVPAQTAVHPMNSVLEQSVDAVVSKKEPLHCPPQDVLPILKLTRIKFQYYGWTEVQASWNFICKARQWNRPSLLAARTVFRQLVTVFTVAGGCVGGMFWNVETGHGS